jgi:hypothetical protein
LKPSSLGIGNSGLGTFGLSLENLVLTTALASIFEWRDTFPTISQNLHRTFELIVTQSDLLFNINFLKTFVCLDFVFDNKDLPTIAIITNS